MEIKSKLDGKEDLDLKAQKCETNLLSIRSWNPFFSTMTKEGFMSGLFVDGWVTERSWEVRLTQRPRSSSTAASLCFQTKVRPVWPDSVVHTVCVYVCIIGLERCSPVQTLKGPAARQKNAQTRAQLEENKGSSHTQTRTLDLLLNICHARSYFHAGITKERCERRGCSSTHLLLQCH